MFRSILVPLDGSRLAERALDVAVPIAQAHASALTLATVRSKSEAAGLVTEREAALYLESMAARVFECLHRIPDTEVLTDTFFGSTTPDPPRRVIADRLHDYVRDHVIDLTVMTTHGRGGLRRVCMGSVADAFVRYGPAPVLVFRPENKRARAAHIAVLLDGTREAEQILHAALDLCETSGARCTLVHVVRRRSDRCEAELAMQRAATRCARDTVAVAGAVVIADDIPRSIIGYAVQHRVDILAMTTRTTNPLRRAFLGSVADTLVRNGNRPVLICNPFMTDEVQSAARDLEAS